MATNKKAAIMQDLTNPASLISQAFSRLTPPQGPFDPDAAWTHVYHDISAFNLKWIQGQMTLTQRAGGHLHVESFRNCPDNYRYYALAKMQCRNDPLRSPAAWQVESKVARRADAPAYLNSGLVQTAHVEDGVLTLQTGDNQRTLELPGLYTCKWCLLDAVGRMPKLGVKELSFTLIDEYDELCPKQTIAFRGKSKVEARGGMIEIWSYQHTGTATMPGVFYVDAAGRTLFYLAGMQLLALAKASGEETGYLK